MRLLANLKNTTWWKAAGIRAIKTVAEALIASIGTTAAVLSDVNWKVAISAAILAGILSVLVSIKGLPEVSEG